MVRMMDIGIISIQGYIRSRPTSVFIFLSIAKSSQGNESTSNQTQKIVPKILEILVAQDRCFSVKAVIKIDIRTCFEWSVAKGSAKKNETVIRRPTSSSVKLNGANAK